MRTLQAFKREIYITQFCGNKIYGFLRIWPQNAKLSSHKIFSNAIKPWTTNLYATIYVQRRKSRNSNSAKMSELYLKIICSREKGCNFCRNRIELRFCARLNDIYEWNTRYGIKTPKPQNPKTPSGNPCIWV